MMDSPWMRDPAATSSITYAVSLSPSSFSCAMHLSVAMLYFAAPPWHVRIFTSCEPQQSFTLSTA